MSFFRGAVVLVYLVTLLGAIEYVCRAQELLYNQSGTAASWGQGSHEWQLGVVEPRSAFRAGENIDIIALVRNNGAGMEIVPLEPNGFTTVLVDSHGSTVAGRDEVLNTTGLNQIHVETNAAVKNVLHISWRYPNLSPGTYRLTASTNIVQGSSMGGAPHQFITHLTSSAATITISR